ncbi:MAG: hypothetical protein ABI598_05580 [Chloroflexota bacterium]
MIAICGSLEPLGRHEALAAAVAVRAAALDATVEVVGIVPEGQDGDATLLALSAVGVGHAAALRAAVRPLESADLDLALRYLPDLRVVVAIGLDSQLMPALAEAAAFAGAPLIVVAAHEALAHEASAYGASAHEASAGGAMDHASAADAESGALPESAIVLQAPVSDPDGTFAGFVATFASRLDAGDSPADAWMGTLQALAVDPVSRPADAPGQAADQ